MNCYKLSNFLENEEIPSFILGAFLSRSIFDSDTIYTEAAFKASKYSNQNLSEYKIIYLEKLNSVSNPFKWNLCNTSEKSFKAKLVLQNDLGLNKERFFYKLYYKVITEFEKVETVKLDSQKRDFIRGFMETRGSIDTTAAYIAQDYYYDSIFESKKYKILTDFCNIPYYVINLNFRDLQKQYYEGITKRNTQFRINSKWYMKYVGMYNDYKADIFANSHSEHSKMIKMSSVIYFDVPEPKYDLNNGADDRFNFYLHNILGRKLLTEEITNLRKSLGYSTSAKTLRNPSLPEMVRQLEEDECVGCKNFYNIKDRTFTHKRTNRPYFEIHHVISLANDKVLDDENNLVKLCPVCHGCLKKGVGLEKEQKGIIQQILLNSNKALNFSENLFDTTDQDVLIEEIYNKLK